MYINKFSPVSSVAKSFFQFHKFDSFVSIKQQTIIYLKKYYLIMENCMKVLSICYGPMYGFPEDSDGKNDSSHESPYFFNH